MKSVSILFLLFLTASFLLADNISSTLAGGLWTSETTWQGGVVPNANDNVWIIGPVVVNASPGVTDLQVEPSGSLRNAEAAVTTIYVNGDLTNSGTIQDYDPPNRLSMRCYGDLTNYGSYTASVVFFLGTEPQSLANYGPFTPDTIYDQVPASSLAFQTDLSLTNTSLDLGGTTLILNGSDLSLSGGLLRDANLQGGNNTNLTLANGAYLYGVSGDDIILNGTVMVRGNVSFGILRNYATLYNLNNNAEALTVTYRLENHGVIKDHPDMPYLALYLSGDLYNYGEIRNRSLTFQTSASHYLYQDASALPLNCQNFTNQTTSGDIFLLSDLDLLSCTANLGSKTMYLFNGGTSHDLSVDGGSLSSGTLATSGFSTLHMDNGAYLNNIHGGDFILQGTVQVQASSYMTFEDLVNYGTLQNYSSGSYSMYGTGNLVNHGTIRNHPSSGILAYYCAGNIANYGSISNDRFYVNGTQDQNILLAAGSTISCAYGFFLRSDIGSAQWYFNESLAVAGLLTDLNLNTYGFAPGTWQPVNGSTFGRHIILGTGETLSAPLGITIFPIGEELRIQWNEVTGAAFYNIYATSDPFVGYAWIGTAYDSDLSDEIVWWDLTPSAAYQFFLVKAAN